MSEFLKEADKLLGNTVKSINDNLFADTENGANGQEGKDERESSTSQKKVEKPTPKKAKPSTAEMLTPIVEDGKNSILEELKGNYKENGREFVLNPNRSLDHRFGVNGMNSKRPGLPFSLINSPSSWKGTALA